LPLYKDIASYNAPVFARDYNFVSKYSLEKMAAQTADAFTTVSKVTSTECRQFLDKEVDIITPNGFDDSFVPAQELFAEKRSMAREKVIKAVEGLINQEIDKNSLLAISSGRYEFRNKGVDLFIDALGELNKRTDLSRQVIAVLAIPANHAGARKEVQERIAEPHFNNPIPGEYLTHGLHYPENDQIIRRIIEKGLYNRPEDKVKIVFVPSYLNGNDGIFNLNYYDFLIGFDLSVFPSYYEPWGYTPLESLAFHIPTVTTTLSGFGQWIESNGTNWKKGMDILERTDDNYDDVVDELTNVIMKYTDETEDQNNETRDSAYELSRVALWKNFISYYKDAYSVALAKTVGREELYRTKQHQDLQYTYKRIKSEKPGWRKVLVTPSLPDSLKRLYDLTRNLWWTWNWQAEELFEMIDPDLWEEYKHNPITLLESLSVEKLIKLEKSNKFLNKLDEVYCQFKEYMDQAENKPDKLVSYFSMEYGLHDNLKIYSGGLGMLAGDYLKQASDSNKNMVGIGLIYRYGYFKQGISLFGDQEASYHPQKFTHLPLIPVRDNDGNWVKVSLALPGRIVFAKIWRLDVGRIPLYLLDTDISDNADYDRSITYQLYGGDNENRLKQELLLGVGGIRLLEALNIKPDVYHCNEGHAAFIGIERLRMLVQLRNFSFQEALEIVRSKSLFTTHTPVPAGHDSFHEDLLRQYIPHYAERLSIDWDTFMNLGRMTENNPNEKFSMSVLAVRLSQEVNGVSKIHGRVSREMFAPLFEGYYPDELHIGHVTNGVHLPTWTSKYWQQYYKGLFTEDFYNDQSNAELWKPIQESSNIEIWELRQKHRKILVDYLKDRLTYDLTLRQEKPKIIFDTIDNLDEKVLTIGFARRFATYKRAHLLFNSISRLSEIINNPERPVQFIFAGKAHPRDRAGQDLIKKIIEVSKKPEFIGKIIFVENYDMELAKKLISGVDIWLNTPTRPLEASGTSGEKAVMNGVVNFSVLDGWWAEGYSPEAGFAIQEARTYANQQFQDEMDTELIYNIFEDEIVPLFYNRNNEDVPESWIGYVKNTISDIAPHFTMKRMLDDYYEKFYSKLFVRANIIRENNYYRARKLAAWKRKLQDAWNNIVVAELYVPDSTVNPLKQGAKFKAEIKLIIPEISASDIGVEVLFGQKDNSEIKEIKGVEEMDLVKSSNDHVIFKCSIPLEKAGVHDYIFRIYAKNPDLPHRQDFNLVKWI